jgi:hypothetical protein
MDIVEEFLELTRSVTWLHLHLWLQSVYCIHLYTIWQHELETHHHPR